MRSKLVLIVALVVLCVSALAVTYPTFDWTAKADEVPAARLMRDFPVDYPETHPLVEGEFDYEHYFTYEEMVYWLQRWAEENPDIVDVYTVGESFLGIPIYQITITNKATGKDTDKPAAFFGGNRHSGEVTSSVVNMLFAWTLISNYGKDAEITALVDKFTYYVRPTENPDGMQQYLTTPYTNRSTVRPMDNDGDGKFDEDPGEDLNGDGFIRQMRIYVGEGKGNYIIDPRDPKGRVMTSVGTGKGDYLVQSEGWDWDGDGRTAEDGPGGLDLHRNYPENWRPQTEATGRGYTQSGAGEYPLSENEMRYMFLWMVTHPNISVVNSQDTSVPMHLRPPSTSKADESMYYTDNAYYLMFDEEGKAQSGYIYAGDVFWTYSNRSRLASGGTLREGSSLFGHGPDYGYGQFGAIWYGDELWGNRYDYIFDYNKDGVVDTWDWLWIQDNIKGMERAYFLDWTPGEHPEYGTVECGGTNPKFWSQNPPAGMYLKLAVEAQHRFNFNVLAKALPELIFKEVNIKANDDGTRTITATAANVGRLPDALKQAWLVKMVRKGTARLTVSGDLRLASGQSASQTIDFFAGELEESPLDRPFTDINAPKWDREKTVSWTVTGTGTATITFSSTRGGVISTTVELK
ncbi:MAG: M14 family metallopeptidase [Mesotoga sp.]